MEKKFSAPSDDPVFVKYWDLLMPKIVERPNFDENHLKHLEILCDLYVEYNNLTKFIKENGYSFSTSSRYGDVSRPHVEVQIRTKVLAEIRAYTKMLGLLIDKAMPPADEEEEHWK